MGWGGMSPEGNSLASHGGESESPCPSPQPYQLFQNWGWSQPSSLQPDRLSMRPGTGTAGTAEAGVILIATELGLQDELTVGQLRLIHAVPARVPRLGGQCCFGEREKG